MIIRVGLVPFRTANGRNSFDNAFHAFITIEHANDPLPVIAPGFNGPKALREFSDSLLKLRHSGRQSFCCHSRRCAKPTGCKMLFHSCKEAYRQAPYHTMNLLERITLEPGKCGGRPCVRGYRIRVSDILDLIAAGASREEILADYDFLESDDITAALTHAARQTDHTVLSVAA